MSELTPEQRQDMISDLKVKMSDQINWTAMSDRDIAVFHDAFVTNTANFVMTLFKMLPREEQDRVLREIGGSSSQKSDRDGGLLFGLPTFEQVIQRRPLIRRAFYGKEN